jgi:hypothetical protein
MSNPFVFAANSTAVTGKSQCAQQTRRVGENQLRPLERDSIGDDHKMICRKDKKGLLVL